MFRYAWCMPFYAKWLNIRIQTTRMKYENCLQGWCFLCRYCLKMFIFSVGVKPDKWCCFLLNDCNDPTAISGGSHWTLLIHGIYFSLYGFCNNKILDPIQKTLWQLDPMIDTRPVHCLHVSKCFYTYHCLIIH